MQRKETAVFAIGFNFQSDCGCQQCSYTHAHVHMCLSVQVFAHHACMHMYLCAALIAHVCTCFMSVFMQVLTMKPGEVHGYETAILQRGLMWQVCVVCV